LADRKGLRGRMGWNGPLRRSSSPCGAGGQRAQSASARRAASCAALRWA
jgi:hypothetical protein